MVTHGRFRLSALGGIILSMVILASPSAAAATAGWSPAVVISASQPSPTPSAFAVNSAGNELWVAAPPVVGGYAIKVAQRSFGGAWSPQATIFTSTNSFISTVYKIYVSIGANNTATVAWQVGFAVLVALRSPSGIWRAPVTISPSSGTAASLVAKADAQGNGVAVWSQMTGSASTVDAVTWTASGVFSNVTQLSESAPSELAPGLAVNEAGTAIVDWGSNSSQIYTSTRPAGGSWSAATAASPVISQGGASGIALDGSGDATVVWEQGSTIDSATRPVGGSWSSPTVIETANFVGPSYMASDAAGDLTAVWVVNSGSGVTSVHAATRPAGSPWGAPANLGPCASTCVLNLAAARDGSIAVVGWSPFGPSANAAVRLGLGTWSSTVIVGSFTTPTYLVAGNNGFASAVWPVRIGVKYHVGLDQSDYR